MALELGLALELDVGSLSLFEQTFNSVGFIPPYVQMGVLTEICSRPTRPSGPKCMIFRRHAELGSVALLRGELEMTSLGMPPSIIAKMNMSGDLSRREAICDPHQYCRRLFLHL
jgi:hypothetical protein